MNDWTPEAAEEYEAMCNEQWQREIEERMLREAEDTLEWHFNYGRKVKHE